MLNDLAEAPTRFEVLAPGEERLEFDDCVVYFAHGDDARSCSVQRLRAAPDALEPTVARVRALLRERGRQHATWEVMTSVQPRETIDRLGALGMRASVPPYAVVMARSSEPPAARPGVVVTSVDTIEEFKIHVSITHEVFGMLERLPAELEHIDAHGARKLADRSFVRYVARVDGVPAGAATATFTDAGVMLHSGSTVESFRRRGVYAATVAHRWREAVARGTPHLVTRAGPVSRPILAKLGFDELAEVHFLVDSIE